MVAINYADLLDAFEFVSFGALFENSAFICVDTGVIYCTSDTLELDEEVPEDLETSERYIAIPHKNELNLGRDLALSFVDQALPNDYNTVAGFFRRKGAYSRFKQLLESRGVLNAWYLFETHAVEVALRQRCDENNVQLSSAQPGSTGGLNVRGRMANHPACAEFWPDEGFISRSKVFVQAISAVPDPD